MPTCSSKLVGFKKLIYSTVTYKHKNVFLGGVVVLGEKLSPCLPQ